jgi:hypothetical protein
MIDRDISIETFNDEGVLHGYQEWYWKSNDSSKIYFRGNAFRGLAIGYHEIHDIDLIKSVKFYIK